jgi:carbon monoxide dehydrogenase subunit G
VRLTNEFEIDAPLEMVWAVLTDVPRVTACIPRGRLLAALDATRFRAAVAVRVGPVVIDYVVTVRIDELDHAANTARLHVFGQQLIGVGAVTAAVHSVVRAAGERTRVRLETSANVGGIVGAVGRPVIEAIARRKLAEFAANVARLANELAVELP